MRKLWFTVALLILVSCHPLRLYPKKSKNVERPICTADITCDCFSSEAKVEWLTCPQKK